jgi:hypothetical protein
MRRRFERKLGVSLEHVRMAHGGTARISANRLNVVAYTVGSRMCSASVRSGTIRRRERDGDWVNRPTRGEFGRA